MFYIKWFFLLAFWGLIGSVLHYTLPQVDIARITDTYERRETPGANRLFWGRGGAGTAADPSGRDVFFIQTRLANDNVMVYRNEDTSWGWPPYFKFDSADLAARADNAISDETNPRWSVVTHYGWRVPLMSWFPNAVAIRPATGPDEALIPWFNIAVIAILIVATMLARRFLLRLLGGD